MKNTINYYYNILAQDIHQKNSVYRFELNGTEFVFMPYNGDGTEFNEIYFFLCRNNIFCNEIIINKDGMYFTLVDNVSYILIKNKCNDRTDVGLDDIVNYNIPTSNYIVKKENWKELWSKKIDYYEYQINQFGKKYDLIRESFSYYVGLTETAISLLNLVDFKNLQYYINHKRINKGFTLAELYNPTNLIVDVKVRDVTEYFKMKFFEKEDIFNEITRYLYVSKLGQDEAVLFLARMLYPTYYFDMYDEIIQGKEEEEKIKYYIDSIQEYEIFIKNVYLYLLQIYQLPDIEWLKKI